MKNIFYLVITSLLFSTANLHAVPIQPRNFEGGVVPFNRAAVLTSRYSYDKEIELHIEAPDLDPETALTLPPI